MLRLKLQAKIGAISSIAILLMSGCGDKTPIENPQTKAPQAGKFGTSTVHGVIKFEGTPPNIKPITPNDQSCLAMGHSTTLPNESFVINGGKLRYVFVWIEDIKDSYPAPPQNADFNQLSCSYQPHVFGIMINQKMNVRNSDPTIHNVQTVSKINTPINLAQPAGKLDVVSFDKPQTMLEFRCSVHPWMHAYAGVMTHPFFAVSAEDGSFTIPKLPAGTYKIAAWQELFGKMEQTVTVKDGAVIEADFTFRPVGKK